MSVHPTSMIRSRAVATAATIVASLAVAGVASAEEPTVTQVSGNPNCASLDRSFHQVKIDPVRQGRTVFGDGRLQGSIVVSGQYFDWSATPGVDAVIVKGGPMANVYRADDEMTGGTGLHAPVNAKSGRPYGLSHISFCTDDVDAKKPEGPRPGPCEPGGPATKPDGQPCETPPPGPCQPGGPATTPDGRPCQAPPAQTEQTPRNEVLGTVVHGGLTTAFAQLNGPGACVDGSFAEVVRGRGIRRVTMFVNGRRIRTLRGPRSRYVVRIDPRRYPSGVMRVTARVRFVKTSGRRPQTLRMTVLRCARAVVPPAFAG